jgi:signal transduction histidine kinase
MPGSIAHSLRCLPRRALLACLACLAVAGQAPATEVGGSPAGRPWRVVVLMSLDPAQPAVQQHDRAFRAALQAAAPGPVTFFTDTLDTTRFDARALEPEFLALTARKYANQPVDLVVGLGNGSVDLLIRRHAALWPGAQVLFSAIDDARLKDAARAGKLPYVGWKLDIDGTLDLIEALQPGARRLLIVGGNTAFDLEQTAAVTALADARPRWLTETWNDLDIDTLRERLSALDTGSAVIFTTMYREGSGRATFPVDALARFAGASGAPIYGLYSTYIGRGAVAGKVIDFEDSGRRTAELAATLLLGRAQADGTLHRLAPTRCIVDLARLETYGLEVAGLPAGCELRNPPRNLWTEYRGVVLAAAGVLLLQALTIAALLLQRRRRRQAEADALQRRTELSRAMRFAAMGELTASIAHEINQPLGAILSNADAADLLLQRGNASTEELREILADIRRDDLRAHEVIRRLRALLEKQEVEHRVIQLHAALAEALALLEAEARRRGMVLEHRLEASDDCMLGDPVQMQQVLLNLGLNAMDAMADTAPADRRLSIATADAGNAIQLTVADHGSGVEASRRTAIFESFYTTKPHGMGLGLPIVRAIVEAHEGRIEVSARDSGDPARGALFTLTLPRRLARAPEPGMAPARALGEAAT